MKVERYYFVGLALAFLCAGSGYGQTTDPFYYPVAEWNGTHYHVMNGSGEFATMKVDDPVIDIPFDNPSAIVAWANGAGDYYTYVVDSYNDRIQFFETNIERYTESLTYAAALVPGSFTDAVSPSTAQFTHGNIIEGSEIILISGVQYIRVPAAQIGSYTSSDNVYAVTDIAIPVITFTQDFDAGSSNIEVEYAYSSGAPNGSNDIDYVLGNAGSTVNGAPSGAPIGITELYPNNSFHPSSFENLEAIAYSQNQAGAAFADLLVVDAGDASEQLIAYTVEEDANTVFNWMSTYDGPLSNPMDVALADDGSANVLASPSVIADWDAAIGTNPTTSFTILNNGLFPNHDYEIECLIATPGSGVLTGGTFQLTDVTTGEVVGIHIISSGDLNTTDPYIIDDFIPGLRWNIDAGTAATDDIVSGDIVIIDGNGTVGTPGEIHDYIFVVEAGADRIKVIKGCDNGSGTQQSTGGAFTDFFAGGQRTTGDNYEVYWVSDGSTASQTFISAIRAQENSFQLYTGEPTNSSTWTEWFRVDDFSGSQSSDQHFMYDYDTQVVTLGDGVYGAIPTAGDTVFAQYYSSIDILNYGSSGSVEERFNTPQGIAARYNTTKGWYDVYISDTNNNRVVKLRFYPGGSTTPAQMDWVTSWTYATSTSDVLNSPVGIDVIEDGAGRVWLGVCDTGNNRVIIYNDVEAEDTSPGGSDAPDYSRTLGAEGNTFGLFMRPEDFVFVANGNDADVYVCDAERGYVLKYREGSSPEIDIKWNISSTGYPPNGAYTFEKEDTWSYMTNNAPTGAYVKFFYSDSLNPSSPILCADSSLAATTTSLTWVIANTPSGPPADGSYFLFARLYDASGVLLDEDKSSTTTANFTINSDLAQGGSVSDALDDDLYLYVQNSATRIINLTVNYPDSIVAAEYVGTFPANLLQILSAESGEAWDGLQNNGTLFYADYDNINGTFTISSSVLGSNTGLLSGVNTVAKLTIQIASEAINTSSRTATGLFDITSGGLTDYKGAEATGLVFNDLNLLVGYLGDIATVGGSPGDPPNMVPAPDGYIGYDDLVAFTMAWNGLGGQQDMLADIGPTTGSVPDLVANPDQKIDAYDFLAFTQMISWFSQQGFSSSASNGYNMIPGQQVIDAQISGSKGGSMLTISASDVSDLMCVQLIISYDPPVCEIGDIIEGEFLMTEAQTYFNYIEGDGEIEIYMARFNKEAPGITGSGELASLVFISDVIEQNGLSVYYDLKDSQGKTIESGELLNTKNTIPETYKLGQNYPNPFNPETSIVFHLPEAAAVKLSIYNVLGEIVAVLVDEMMDAGVHQAIWNGTNMNGEIVASGLYLYTINADDFFKSKKMIMLK